jgi:hypothetical protein
VNDSINERAASTYEVTDMVIWDASARLGSHMATAANCLPSRCERRRLSSGIGVRPLLARCLHVRAEMFGVPSRVQRLRLPIAVAGAGRT